MLEGLASAPNRDDRVARAEPPCDVRDELRARPARSVNVRASVMCGARTVGCCSTWATGR